MGGVTQGEGHLSQDAEGGVYRKIYNNDGARQKRTGSTEWRRWTLTFRGDHRDDDRS